MITYHMYTVHVYDHQLVHKYVPRGWQITPASLLCWQSLVFPSKLHFNSSVSWLLHATLFIMIGPVPWPYVAPERATASKTKPYTCIKYEHTHDYCICIIHVHCITFRSKAELSTHNVGISIVPPLVTHRSPLVVNTDFNTSTHWIGAILQTNLTQVANVTNVGCTSWRSLIITWITTKHVDTQYRNLKITEQKLTQVGIKQKKWEKIGVWLWL